MSSIAVDNCLIKLRNLNNEIWECFNFYVQAGQYNDEGMKKSFNIYLQKIDEINPNGINDPSRNCNKDLLNAWGLGILSPLVTAFDDIRLKYRTAKYAMKYKNHWDYIIDRKQVALRQPADKTRPFYQVYYRSTVGGNEIQQSQNQIASAENMLEKRNLFHNNFNPDLTCGLNIFAVHTHPTQKFTPYKIKMVKCEDFGYHGYGLHAPMTNYAFGNDVNFASKEQFEKYKGRYETYRELCYPKRITH